MHICGIRSMQLFSGMYRTCPIISEIALCVIGSSLPNQCVEKNGGAVFELAQEWTIMIN